MDNILSHSYYMQRALELAKHGQLHVSPNPMVGCVLVHQGRIIGEGYHTAYGKPHAEVNAIASVENKELLKESTLYVTLEPCSHVGKTPPCADLIIENKIPHVVIAVLDSNEKVCGQGIEKLKKAGCKVEIGILEKEAKELNKRFFCFHEQKRPFIILKWAQTLDSFLDSNERGCENRESYWITNNYLRHKVHQWRAEENAIFVGANTILHDNPQLNIRYFAEKNPVRVTFLSNLFTFENSFLPLNPLKGNSDIADNQFSPLGVGGDYQQYRNFHIFDLSQPTIVFNLEKEEKKDGLYFCRLENKDNLQQQMLSKLYEMKIQSLLVEGGQHTLQQFIDMNLWDEARVLVGNTCFGSGLEVPRFQFVPDKIDDMKGDKIMWYKNNQK